MLTGRVEGRKAGAIVLRHREQMIDEAIGKLIDGEPINHDYIKARADKLKESRKNIRRGKRGGRR